MQFAERAPHVQYIIHLYSAPCQNVSGLNAGRAGVQGPESRLVEWVPRVAECFRAAFPWAEMVDAGEN
eukprot:5924231-Lingulodinium_polyedra.AAC.1